MVYGRQVQDRELNFEASGALLDASLVMRDRESDSWWSIMTARAIGGEMEGTWLEELPLGEKTTWGQWRQRHPNTTALSVDGVEHDDGNPYDNYITTTDKTFRGLELKDSRLDAKAPIYSFRLGEVPYAVPHDTLDGARLFTVEAPEGSTHQVLLHREAGISVYASTGAWLVPKDLRSNSKGHWSLAASNDAEALSMDLTELLAYLDGDKAEGVSKLSGFDTFWYTWVNVNPETRLLR